MRKWGYNPFTNRLDAVLSITELDARYVKKAGDTMTGELVLPGLESTAGIKLHTDKKLVFDMT